MKCQGCGHDYPGTITRCTRCGRLTPGRRQRANDARLLEFPQKPRPNLDKGQNETSLPQWRQELNERVREIKARRDGADPEAGHAQQELERAPAVSTADARAKARVLPANNNEPLTTGAPQLAAERAVLDAHSSRTGSGPRVNNAIVEAALTRVRRASENASRAALPRIEPARAAQPAAKGSLAIDKEATARALEPAADPRQTPELAPPPAPKAAEPSIASSEPVEAPPASPPIIKRRTIKAPEDSFSYGDKTSKQVFDGPLDEIEPLDYLEAEIKKVDQALSAEFSKNESPSLATHVVIMVIDILAIAVSCSPFIALIQILNGSFNARSTQVGALMVVVIVSLFYFALTQCLAGKTFGMMLTNTRLVDARTYEDASAQRALLRAAGYLIALAPFMLGWLWIASNRKRRGWHDLISGTFVARDF